MHILAVNIYLLNFRPVVFVGFVLLYLFVWFVCTFLEKGKEKSIGESMALHFSAAPCYGASAIAGACGAQVLVLWFVCLSVRLSVRSLSSCLFSSSSLGFGCSSQLDHVCGLAGAALSAQGPPAMIPRRRLSYLG